MSLQDALRALRERWLIVVAAILIGLLGSVAYFVARPEEYTAKVTMYVAASPASTTIPGADSAYQGSLLSQQRVASYVQLLSSPQVANAVIQQLHLTASPEELSKRITASFTTESVLIEVAVVGTSPKDVVAIANSLSDVFPRMVDELEKPAGAVAGVAPVSVRVVRPIQTPDAPSSTGLGLTLGLGLLAGLAIGLATALVRDTLDRSVKSVDALTAAARAPNLGTIAHDPRVPKHPLTLQEDAQSPRAEAFRQLRTNLQFIDVDRPRKVLVVTSSLAGEGKTTAVCNLAVAMAAAGSNVLVIEGDLRRPKAADLLGLDRNVGLTSILTGAVRKDQAIQRWSAGKFDFLASGPLPPNASEILASQNMQNLLGALREEYDVVLIDSPPLLPVTDAAVLASAADGALLLCRFKRTTREQVKAAVRALDAVSARLLGTVFTMVPKRGPHAEARYGAYRSDPGAMLTGDLELPHVEPREPVNVAPVNPAPMNNGPVGNAGPARPVREVARQRRPGPETTTQIPPRPAPRMGPPPPRPAGPPDISAPGRVGPTNGAEPRQPLNQPINQPPRSSGGKHG